MDWQKVKEEYDKDLAQKLTGLPDHREVTFEQKPLRDIISHELPETASLDIYRKLIDILLSQKPLNIKEIRKEYLSPELAREKLIIEENKDEYERLSQDARDWVKDNLSEAQLRQDYKDHKSYLGRRYTIYENPETDYQTIAIDTLTRFALINKTSYNSK